MAATELLAVACGFAYILLAIRQSRACWIAGGISTALYVAIFLQAGLPLQAALQVVYVAMALFGWIAWRPDARTIPQPRSWPWRRQLAAIAGVAIAAVIAAPWLSRFRGFDAPLADALGTLASLVATWLMVRRYLETWAWWIVIDTGLAALFASRGLHATAWLYLAYALLAIVGWRSWRRSARAPR